MAKALTQKGIENAVAGATRREVPDGLCPGLYLVIQPSGVKSWAVRYRLHGRPSKHTLGGFPALSLAKARERARSTLEGVTTGIDPAIEKRKLKQTEAASGGTGFRAVAGRFIKLYAKANCREATWREYERQLNAAAIPAWKDKPIDTVTGGDVVALLDGIAAKGRGVMANRTLATLRRLFNWTVERGMIEASPCERVKPPVAEASRDRVLTDAEIKLVWRACESQGWPFGQMVQVLLLTGQRLREVAEATRAEIDAEKKLWIIPKERTKNGIAHPVPVSNKVAAIFAALPVIEPSTGTKAPGYLFTTNGETAVSGFSRAKLQIDKAIFVYCKAEGTEAPPHWTFHDLRRTMASGMARLGISVAVVEKVLNHTSGSFAGVAGVYQRHDFAEEKRKALDAWASYLDQIATGRAPDNVVRLAS